MNRELQHTMTALTASAAVFALLVLAANPGLNASPSAPLKILMISADNADAATDPNTDVEALPDAPASANAPRQLRRTRALLALPYFSFAQGLRHSRS